MKRSFKLKLKDEGMFDLYVGGELQKDIVNSIPTFRENPLVQKAIEDVEKLIAKRQAYVDKSKKQNNEQGKDIQKTTSQKRREAMCI